MLRSVALTLAAVLIARVHEPRVTTGRTGDQDIHQLMTSARNAPAPLCALAVAAVGNYGWGRWTDAPVTLRSHRCGSRGSARGRKGRDSVSTADVTFLFENLQIDDACVRELAVRLLAGAEESQVATGLHAAARLGRLVDS